MFVVIVQMLECESHLVLYVRFFQCLVPPCCANERRAQWMEVSGPARESGTQAATEQGWKPSRGWGLGSWGQLVSVWQSTAGGPGGGQHGEMWLGPLWGQHSSVLQTSI